MMKSFAAMAVLVLLSACASRLPITKADITPVYAGQAPEYLNVAVVDHRSFILSGDKEEWFEGMMKGPYFTAYSAGRGAPESDHQPFALYLSSMLDDGMVAAGSIVTVIPLAMGTEITEAIRQSSTNSNPSIIFIMQKSRFVIGGYRAEYEHNFDVFVVNQDGETLADKNFTRFNVGIPDFNKYDPLDFYAMVYKRLLDEILNDPDIATALAKASNR